MENLNEIVERVFSKVLNGSDLDNIDKAEMEQVVKYIQREREIDKWSQFCNTDCLRYCQGTCPYIKHRDCPRYANVD